MQPQKIKIITYPSPQKKQKDTTIMVWIDFPFYGVS